MFNVLSLFDGLSCGKIALDRAGIKIDNYYSSEIDKYAIKVNKANNPNTTHLGDVTKWRDWEIPKIDLLIGGSPCQGFSFAGRQLNFQDPRSALFFEFVNILNHVKPKYFMLENVRMKKEYQDIISNLLGVEPIEINSSLVSAQNRKRLYWTNIPGVKEPEDKGIVLLDVLETVLNKELLREKSKTIRVGGRNSPINSRQEWDSPYIKISKKGVYKKFQDKASCLTGGGHSGGNHSDMDLIGQKLQHIGNASDIKGLECIKRVYAEYGKDPTVTTMTGGNRHPKVAINDYEYRRLTPLECERLQNIPDNYTNHVSNSQRYKMLGNGWTVDVIAHIFRGLK